MEQGMGSHYGVTLGIEGLIIVTVIVAMPLLLLAASVAVKSVGKRRRVREAAEAKRAENAECARAALRAQQARLTS